MSDIFIVKASQIQVSNATIAFNDKREIVGIFIVPVYNCGNQQGYKCEFPLKLFAVSLAVIPTFISYFADGLIAKISAQNGYKSLCFIEPKQTVKRFVLKENKLYQFVI